MLGNLVYHSQDYFLVNQYCQMMRNEDDKAFYGDYTDKRFQYDDGETE